jgi:hypothetical protein
MMSPLGPWNNFLIRQVTFKYMWQLKRGDRMADLTVWSKEVIAWQVWLYDQKRWSHGRFDYDQKRWSHGRFDSMMKRGDRMAGLTVWSKEVITWQVWLYDQKRWSHGRFDCMIKRGDHMAGLTVWSKEVITWQVWLYDQKRWSHGRFDCMIKRKTTNRQTRPTKHYTENLRLSYTKPTTAGDLMFSGGYVVPALLVEPVV